MQIKIRSTGTMNLSDDARPSHDDLNDIISSLVEEHLQDAHSDEGARLENEGRLFQKLCDESVKFRQDTNDHFQADCKAWLAKEVA